MDNFLLNKKRHTSERVQKTIESYDEPIKKSSKGYKLIAKMGYKEGDTIGKNDKGLVTPVKPVFGFNFIGQRAEAEKVIERMLSNLTGVEFEKSYEFQRKVMKIEVELRETLINLQTMINVLDFKIDESQILTAESLKEICIALQEYTVTAEKLVQLKKTILKLDFKNEVRRLGQKMSKDKVAAFIAECEVLPNFVRDLARNKMKYCLECCDLIGEDLCCESDVEEIEL